MAKNESEMPEKKDKKKSAGLSPKRARKSKGIKRANRKHVSRLLRPVAWALDREHNRTGVKRSVWHEGKVTRSETGFVTRKQYEHARQMRRKLPIMEWE
jgi:hypothetical protein